MENKIDKQNVEKCIKDLKKIYEAESKIKDLEIKCNSNNSNLMTYLKYIIENNIITNLEEIFEIIKQVPEISNDIAQAIYKYGLKSINTNKVINPSYDNSRYQYNSKGYDRVQDIPGFGTEFNERCLPEGVYINRKNQRC